MDSTETGRETPPQESDYVKGTCPQCSGRIEFPLAGIGSNIECPHCKSVITLQHDENGVVPAVEQLPKKEDLMRHFKSSDGEIFARFARSPNREFVLIWRDEWAGGKNRTKGSYYLFRNEKELCKGHLLRPNDGHVADNGSFVFCDWLFTEKLESVFYAFNSEGEALIEKRFRANLYNAAISQDGIFAACQTAVNRDSRHSELLTLFDLLQRTESWHIQPPFWPETYEFNSPTGELVIRSSSGVYKSCVLSMAQPSTR